ncbi:MAG TPA: CBS domain-containing protein [Candidatus Binatia bacterium]|nr:CBS domain-containing protein [Candidatus Binatia bacterium]
MKIAECMTRDVSTVRPGQSIQEAAQLMADLDTGVLPVQDGDRLVGMITDRDIVVRALCSGKAPGSPVADAMTREVKYCYEDEGVEQVARFMGDLQVRRLPVLSRDKRLVGIVTLGDLAGAAGRDDVIGETLADISRTGGLHSQSQDRSPAPRARPGDSARH